MTKATLKKKLYKAIDVIEDETLLEAVYTILQSRLNEYYELKPMTREEFLKRNQIAQKDIQTGNLIEHNQLKKKYRAA